MGVFYTVDVNIRGQIKPYELGPIALAEINLICAKYGLTINSQSGFCNPYREDVRE